MTVELTVKEKFTPIEEKGKYQRGTVVSPESVPIHTEDGWITCDLTSISTVFQSNQDDG